MCVCIHYTDMIIHVITQNCALDINFYCMYITYIIICSNRKRWSLRDEIFFDLLVRLYSWYLSTCLLNSHSLSSTKQGNNIKTG